MLMFLLIAASFLQSHGINADVYCSPTGEFCQVEIDYGNGVPSNDPGF